MASRIDSSPDEGFTLIELLITSLLTVLVLSVVAGLFISSTTVQKTVSTVTDASNAGQLAANSVQEGIRNSTAFKLVPSGANQLLVARTVLGDTASTPACVAWYYSAATPGSIRYTRLAAKLTAPPAASTVAGWTLLASGVKPATGTTIFSRTSTTSPVLALAFSSTAGTHPSVRITSSAVSRVGGTDISSCYSGT